MTTNAAFLRAAQDRGCRVQVGTDMLFEQIPADLEFFGLPVTKRSRCVPCRSCAIPERCALAQPV